MKETELKLLRDELMKPDWTETLHDELKELTEIDANKIIESMTDAEIYQKVNNRRFQGDYIADYLCYIWEINELAFWKQIKITFDNEIGILWGDDMQHFRIMCENKVPKDVLFTMINYIVFDSRQESKNDLNAIGCVIKAQVKKYWEWSEIKKYILGLPDIENNEVLNFIKKLIKQKCPYNFLLR